MLYFWLWKRRWIAGRGRHLAVGSRTAGNCWIWITAQELGHWSPASHNSLHGLNPRLYTSWQASVVCLWNFLITGTGFDLLLQLLLAKMVPYFSSFLLIVQQTEGRWCEVIWECVLRAGTGTFCAHPDWAVSPSFVLSRRDTLLCLPPLHGEIQTDPELGNRANLPRGAADLK